MNILPHSGRVVLGASILLLAVCPSCRQSESSATSSTPSAQKPSVEAPLLPADVEPVPTADEAAAQAAKEIDDANADAELEKLKKELGDG